MIKISVNLNIVLLDCFVDQVVVKAHVCFDNLNFLSVQLILVKLPFLVLSIHTFDDVIILLVERTCQQCERSVPFAFLLGLLHVITVKLSCHE